MREIFNGYSDWNTGVYQVDNRENYDKAIFSVNEIKNSDPIKQEWAMYLWLIVLLLKYKEKTLFDTNFKDIIFSINITTVSANIHHLEID